MATFTQHRSSKPIEYQGSKKYNNQFPSLSQVKPRSQQTWGPSTNKTTYKRSYNEKAVEPKKFQSKCSAIECAYCHEQGHHIKNCQKAADATARKQNAKKSNRQQKFQLKKSRAVERIREQVIASQQYCQISIENSPNVSNSEDLETEVSNPVTTENEVTKSDIENQIQEKKDLMKTLKSWADKCDLQEEIDELEQLL
tara:strand:+ start:1228 stop:1821 length:594 start_codon:yes stop_codon:yes gene_type:complete